ncbi:zinc-binding dehydrogenase, partial [Vibrio fortis]
MGLLDIGQPKEGDTLVVAAATGPVGATVGQIGKLKGCRVIGVAGGEEKCRHAKEVLGFDECIDHKADDFAEQLAAACDKGIDVYFENVGGKVFDAVMPLLNTGARIPVCGLISQYNATSLPDGPDRMSALMGMLLVKRIKMQGFIIFDDYAHRYNEFATQMAEWLAQGKIQYKEQVVEGFENTPRAYLRDSVSFLAPPELKSVHPLGKSPVIEDQGMIITESGAITDYLIETYGNGRFAPQRGTKEHLEYNQWLHFAESSGILPLLLKIFVAKDGCETNFLAQYAEDENSKIMAYLEQSLEGKSYLVGETLTGADFMMSFIVEAMENFGASHAYPN